MLPRVTEARNQELIKIVTLEEIRRATFSIKGGTALDADGMNVGLFQTYWSVVGEQIIKDVKSFFETESLPHE